MNLSSEEQAMLDGSQGWAVRKAMEILAALGTIYGAERMLPITSVQIAGVSFDNLGEAGLSFLDEMAAGGGKTRVLATLNPAGMDLENWQSLGISPEFAANQARVLAAFTHMGVITTCSCTPYLSGNLPHYGEHIAWAESSAVCYANSVIGARTNREGGPSALAAALTGRTPAYGYHIAKQRLPAVTVTVEASEQTTGGLEQTAWFGALGKIMGEKLSAYGLRPVPYIRGIANASLEALKSFCASLATYGGAALFHMEDVTPEAGRFSPPKESISVTTRDVQAAAQSLMEAPAGDVDFFSLGCPHLSLIEVAHLAELLQGKKVRKEFWVTTSRPIKHIADRMGYTQVIEASGAKFAVDTCCVVAPIRGRFQIMATDSAKACYYASAKNRFRTVFAPFDEVVRMALGEV
jgi:predicted aconitase